MSDTKQSLEQEAAELEQKELELSDSDEPGDIMCADYYHVRAQHLRAMAVNAPDERDQENARLQGHNP